jgi:hypothetical protein
MRISGVPSYGVAIFYFTRQRASENSALSANNHQRIAHRRKYQRSVCIRANLHGWKSVRNGCCAAEDVHRGEIRKYVAASSARSGKHNAPSPENALRARCLRQRMVYIVGEPSINSRTLAAPKPCFLRVAKPMTLVRLWRRSRSVLPADLRLVHLRLLWAAIGWCLRQTRMIDESVGRRAKA